LSKECLVQMDYIFLNPDTVYRQGMILRAPLTDGAVTIGFAGKPEIFDSPSTSWN